MKKRVYNRHDNKRVIQEEVIAHELILEDEWNRQAEEWAAYIRDWEEQDFFERAFFKHVEISDYCHDDLEYREREYIEDYGYDYRSVDYE